MTRPRFALAACVLLLMVHTQPSVAATPPPPPAVVAAPSTGPVYGGPTSRIDWAKIAQAAAEARWYVAAATPPAVAPPAAKPRPRPEPRPVYADSGGLPAGLVCIRTKESGGNYTDLSPGGKYRGAYQYSVSTWNGYGGFSDPAAAPPSTQDERALADYSRGTGQIHQNWPQTSRACGL